MSQKTLPPPDCVAGWDVRHVADWLRHNDMSEFVCVFSSNNVSGSRLLELDENKIRSFNCNLPQQKITKLLDKVRKSKKEKSGLFNKLKQSRNSVPVVPNRDYKRSTNPYQKPDEDDGGWGSDFSNDDEDDAPEDNYEPPPDPMRSEAPRYPQSSNHSQFNSQVGSRYSDEEDVTEDYIEPIETVRFKCANVELNDDGPEELYIVPIEDSQSPETPYRHTFVDDYNEEQYLAPDGDDELYEVPEDDSSYFQARIPAPIKPPARPPKTNKDYISKQSRPPQILVPAPSLNAKPADVPPRPPARRSASPARSPYSYRPQPEIQEDFEEDTYDAPNNDDEDDCDGTYAVPDDTSAHQRPVQPPPSSRQKVLPKQPTNFMKAPARAPRLPPSPKNTPPFSSPANDMPSLPPPIVRYPKTDTSKTASEPQISKADENPLSAVVSKMKQAFEQRSPTLPRREVCNDTNTVNETKKSSFLHVGKRLPQPPLPGKNDLPTKEPRSSSQPELPVRKPVVLQKPHALPDSNSTSSSSVASKNCDSAKLHPSPAQRNPPSPAQRNPPSPSHRVAPNSSHAACPKSPVNSMDGCPWYHADLAREKAQKSLEDFKRDGAFLVRNSKRGGQKNPFTLSLWYNNQVRNLQMRLRSDEKYALGSEKEGEHAFDSPRELVEFHQINPLILANNEGKTKLKHACPVF